MHCVVLARYVYDVGDPMTEGAYIKIDTTYLVIDGVKTTSAMAKAAPEMYKALSLISGWLCCAPMISDPAEFQESAVVFFEEAEKALAKARGES